MKLLFLCRDISDQGGIQQVTACLANNFSTMPDIDSVYILSIFNKYKVPHFDISNGINCSSVYNGFIDLKSEYFSIPKKISNFLSTIPFDILVIQGCEYSLFVEKQWWRMKEIVVCEHGYYGFGHIFGFHWRGVRKTIKNASAIVTLTNLDSLNFKKNCKRNIPIISMANPISFNDAITVGYNTECKTIVSCGSLIPIKGFDKVIEAANIVLKKHSDWKWEIFGDGPLKNELEKKIKSYCLENNLFLRGFSSNKQTIYSNKSFLVMTSVFEGFGMVLVEAMQFSLPLVAFNAKYGPREIIANGINGLTVEEGSIGELVYAIEKLINDKDMRVKMAKNSVSLVRRFDENAIANQWLSFFREILS